ncbi:6,7-dimethyl-8-ribityllumazine synthase [Bradyrhizobium sp. USDA 4461]
MEYQPVSSSTVAAIGYVDATNTLGVMFVKGGEYHYHGVPREVFEGLLGASSVGAYFDANVKKASYPFSKVG